METKRICLRCRREYPQDVVICEECKEQLADVAFDFEVSPSMVREPVLLSNGQNVEIMYLEEALRAKNIPYYVKEGRNAVPTNHYKEGIVEIVPFTNFYVDKGNWKAAREALKGAMEETGKDVKAPVVFPDMPEERSEENLKEPGEDNSAGMDAGEDASGGLRGWFMDQDLALKGILGVITILCLIGLIRIIFS